MALVALQLYRDCLDCFVLLFVLSNGSDSDVERCCVDIIASNQKLQVSAKFWFEVNKNFRRLKAGANKMLCTHDTIIYR